MTREEIGQLTREAYDAALNIDENDVSVCDFEAMGMAIWNTAIEKAGCFLDGPLDARRTGNALRNVLFIPIYGPLQGRSTIQTRNEKGRTR
jgi:hypothetical protein